MPGGRGHDVDALDSDEEADWGLGVAIIVPKSSEGWIDLQGLFDRGQLRTRCRRLGNFPNFDRAGVDLTLPSGIA